MANIQVIQPTDADGYLKEVYDQILESRGKIAEIYKIQSLNPRSIIRHLDLYMTLMYGKSPLTREDREMIGVVVSSANNCAYCIAHHGEALNYYWKDKKKIGSLIKNHSDVELTEEQHLLCEMADIITRFPDSRKVQPLIRKLKKRGFSDRSVLDATMVIAYFNFVNRLALSLDVNAEEDPGGYKY